MKPSKLAAFIIPLALSACAWRSTPVPIISDNGSVALLVGHWSGEFSSGTPTGRSGSISFDLASEKDTAFCDIVMIPKSHQLQVTGDLTSGPVVRPQIPTEPLQIRFIRLGDNRITGTLESYTDHDCACTVSTTFHGTFTGSDTIEGTFTTRATVRDEVQSGGRWKVTRQKVHVSTN